MIIKEIFSFQLKKYITNRIIILFTGYKNILNHEITNKHLMNYLWEVFRIKIALQLQNKTTQHPVTF